MTKPKATIQFFADSNDAPVRWRLLSGNNRELGRSVDEHPDPRACELAVRDAQAEIVTFATRLHRVDPHRWRWEVSRDGVPIAVAGHSFDRQIRCEIALTQFLAALPSASVRAGLLVSNARRWGSTVA
jgi:hypothetical protein